MNESGNGNGNGLAKNWGALILLLGILVVALSYFMVYNDYNEKIDTIEGEIKTAKVRRDELQALQNGRSNIESKRDEAQKEYDKIIKLYDGGICYDGQIMDEYSIIEKDEIQIWELNMTTVDEPYLFGELPSSNPSVGEGGAAAPDFTTERMVYSVKMAGTYDQIKRALRDVISFDGKRKVITSVSIEYDTATNQYIAETVLNEYAILGEDRKMTEPKLKDYAKGNMNVFYEQVISE